MTEKRKLFKDWFDRDAAKSLAKQVASAYPKFDQKAFVRSATRGLSELEFHARVKHFSHALAAGLPPVPEALQILVQSLPDPLPDCEAVTDGWLLWPVGHYIGEHGLEYYSESMHAMTELTMRFSAEFPIRAFIEKYPERTMDDLLKLTSHPNPHVRRWCSEGCRPRLPWGRKLRALVSDPAPIWPILEALKDDPELYVRRSVANNLNDIAKDHPQEVVRRCGGWLKNAPSEREWVVRHGLRSLIKQGDPTALDLLGYGKPECISGKLQLNSVSIGIGQSVELSAAIRNTGKRKALLMVDYAVHYVRKGGKSSVKVFKWKTVELAAGEEQILKKSHAMKQTTVRALYPGKHRIELQVNGVRMGLAVFELQ